MGPLQLYQGDDLISEHFEFLIQNLHWLDWKASLELDPNHAPFNHMVSIRNIIFKKINMKYIMYVHKCL